MKQSLLSSWRDVSTTLAMTVGSPSAHRRGIMLKLISVLVLILTIGVGQMWGADATMTGGTGATSSTFSGASGYKCGSKNSGGSMSVTIPAGATVLSVYIAVGYGDSNVSVSISRSSGTISSSSVSPNSDSGISNNSPYTLANAESTYLKTFTLSSVNTETTVTFSTSSGKKRFGVWGAKICYSPTSLTNTTIGSTTATLGWSDTKNVNSYEVYHSTSSTAPTAGSSGTITTSKSINLTNLTPSQQYHWWVRAYDSYCKTAWVAGTSFTTTASGCTNNITINKGTESHGTFELNKSGSQATCSGLSVVVTPSPADHYHVGSVSATTGETGTDNGDGTWTITYAANTTGSSTINVVFAEDPAATISFENAGTPAPTTSGYYVGDSYTLPSTNNYNCSGGKAFVGWSTVPVASQDSKPSSNFHEPGANVTLAASQTFYAVFATASGTPETWTQITALANITAGTYVIVNNGHALPSATTSSAPVYSDDYEVTISNSKITSSITEGITWYFAGTNTAMTITNKDDSYLYATSANNGVRVGSTSDTWSFAANSTAFQMQEATNSRYCAGTSNGDWRSYTSGTSKYYYDGGKVYLFKKSGGTTYSAYSTDCCTSLAPINGSFNRIHF